MINYIKQNTAYPLIVVVTSSSGDFVTGLTITYEVRKSSDNSLTTSGTLTNTGNIYTDSINITNTGDYYVLYFSPTNYENGKEDFVVQTTTLDDIQIDIDSIAEKLAKVLGLVQSNHRFTNQTYSANNCLTAGVITIYPTSTDTNDQTNAIASYQINATYDAQGRLTDYKVTEI